jgi:hypothetical protein
MPDLKPERVDRLAQNGRCAWCVGSEGVDRSGTLRGETREEKTCSTPSCGRVFRRREINERWLWVVVGRVRD